MERQGGRELARRRAESAERNAQLLIWAAVSGEPVTIVWLDEESRAEAEALVEAFLQRIR